ncbi:MAG: twin-arginine translocase TatA/TatE family subunit [Christensenellaceae bacterium]|nr:twin-arginine translocase TatA/TatE family subunit [Christensenellaceae bacterium]
MTELILLLLIAFVVVGPQDLPKVARALGRVVRYLRNLIREIKRETGFDEVAGEIRDVQREIRQDLREIDIRKDLAQAEAEINKGFQAVEKAIDADGIKKDIEKGLGGKSS